MRYFLLNEESDPEVLGVNNGIFQVEMDANNPTTKKLKDFFAGTKYWERQKTVPDFDVNCSATLLKKAKLTDFLYFSPFLFTCPFMVSERVVDIFNKFNMQKYYIYPVALYDKEKMLNEKYYLFCCPLLGYEYIDFRKSVFYTGNRLRGKEYISINDENEYRAVTSAKVEKLVLNSNFDSSLDLFALRIGGIHVSEGLKDAIEILNLTGVYILDDEPFIIAP